MHEPDLRDVFIALAASLGTADILQTLNDVVEACVTHTSATEGGIVLADSTGLLHVAASTSERAEDVEEAQLGTSEGPCLDCVHSGEPVEVADLDQKLDVWPGFTPIAKDRGFRAVHATPMRLRGRTIGSLCLFTPEPGALSDRERRSCRRSPTRRPSASCSSTPSTSATPSPISSSARSTAASSSSRPRAPSHSAWGSRWTGPSPSSGTEHAAPARRSATWQRRSWTRMGMAGQDDRPTGA